MCFSPQNSKYQKDFFKLYCNKKIKENLLKAQIYLISNKELISRNHEKIKNIKKNTFLDSDKDNNIKGSLLQNTPKILNNSCLNNLQNKNMSININNYKNKEKNLISSYSFHGRAFLALKNSNNNENNNNKCFNNNSKIKQLKDNLNKIQQNENNFSLNIKSILIGSSKNSNKNRSCINFYKKNSKEKKTSGNTRNNANKKNNYKKIGKFPLSPYNENFNSFLLHTTRQKSICFSSTPSINSSYTNIISNINNNISDKIEIKKKLEKYVPKEKEYKKKKVIKNNEKKMNDNDLFKKKLKKTFFDYINRDINKSKEKRNESINLFNKLYEQLTKKAFSDLKPLFKMKSKKSSSHSNKNNTKYNYNNKNDLIRNNNVVTSGSINNSFQDEMYAEEIHFKSVKYYHELKNSERFCD